MDLHSICRDCLFTCIFLIVAIPMQTVPQLPTTANKVQKVMNFITYPGTSLMTVTAEDGDKSEPNTVIVQVVSDNCPGLFHLDTVTGVINLASAIDPTSRNVLRNDGVCTLGILASEDGPHPQAGGNSTSSTEVKIYISSVGH